ncbi:type VI secretion system tip protein TssI/VgrG [Metapseudomonas otitidis]|uniref:type VI secretion system Vgr family protein n=1 Tax=Metapseudomonas otitidis TaxID=319939 RepID=UPI00244C882F|nr:type VI secretion system tip protein TssI/VgrG [Pseudomonas otitidis]MDH0335409.1 type VI secretion system tip protein VgrG [Pseudomonas otitidis]
MFNPANQAHFSLDIEGANPDFKVLAFTGHEALNQPFRFDIELVSERSRLDLESLLHKPAFLAFTPDGRGVHGQVFGIAVGEIGNRLTHYHLTLVPRLAYLALRHNQRIFQHLSVPQIIGQVLEDHGILADAYRFRLGPKASPPRDYCTQYDESDLHFISRLCEEEGLHFHFEHQSDSHLLVFGEDASAFPKLGRPVAYLANTGQVADEPVIKRFGLRMEARTLRVTRRDYFFEKPRLLMEAAHTPQDDTPQPDLEDYDYPGRFTDRDRGRRLARKAQERHRRDYSLADGDSDEPRLVSGHLLSLSDHPKQEWNDLWLITALHHEGKQPQVLEEFASIDGMVKSAKGALLGAAQKALGVPLPSTSEPASPDSDFKQGYRNRFQAIPWDVPARPDLNHPKPRILGSQTAVVTGPKGEEIHCDRHGRIKVQFHWDREGQADEHTSCWLRVASTWAGNAYGAIAIPRIGMEVLVTFLEGDPDQPLVTGCLYHGVHQPPYELPANKTRTLLKTDSSPGGGGYNELRIEDRKGQEQIYVHAQRDWDENIEHDQKIRVGHQRHDRVEGSVYSEFLGEQHHTLHKDRKTELKLDDHLTIGNEQHIQLGSGQFIEAGQEIHLSSGLKVVMDAGSEVTFQAGGSFVKLDASGVTLSGPNIKINSGGGPGSGSGVAQLPPANPAIADLARSGKPLIRPQPQPLQPTSPAPARALKFDIRLQDIPGDEGFPLSHTPWQIDQGDATAPLMRGESDAQGKVTLSDDQQRQLAERYPSGELWLCYPGQRVRLRLHIEQQAWNAERHALAAFDYQAKQPAYSACHPLDSQRAKLDNACAGSLFSHLQSKE